MTTGYYCAIFPFCGGGKKKDDKKTKAFYDWATTGIPVINSMFPADRIRELNFHRETAVGCSVSNYGNVIALATTHLPDKCSKSHL